MAEPNSEKPTEEEDGPARTPFDNPFFLPVMLWLFTAWFIPDRAARIDWRGVRPA